MKRWHCSLIVLFFLPLVLLGAVSLFDIDPTLSVQENRKLAERPDFSGDALF